MNLGGTKFTELRAELRRAEKLTFCMDPTLTQSFIWTSEVMLTCRTVPPDKNFSSNTIS